MHAFLFLKSNKEDIIKFCKEQKAKVIYFYLQKIEDSRELIKITKYSFSEKTAIIIENIDTATTETANAFLKNLEEPNKNLIYILTAKSLEGVLPTIISRCQVINFNHKKILEDNNSIKVEFEKFLTIDINEKFKIIEKIKDRGEAIIFLENLILTKHDKKDFSYLENYLKTLKNLNKNGNVSLQLTNLLVTSF